MPDISCARASCGFGNPRPVRSLGRPGCRGSAGARSSDSAARRFGRTASKVFCTSTNEMKGPGTSEQAGCLCQTFPALGPAADLEIRAPGSCNRMQPRGSRQRRSAEFRLRSKAVRPHGFESFLHLNQRDEGTGILRTNRVPMPDISCARASCGFGNPRPVRSLGRPGRRGSVEFRLRCKEAVLPLLRMS
jgi:hypothetical protein